MPFAFGPEYLAVALFGVVIGIIFGAIPGMTATSLVPDAARAAGIEFPDLCERILQEAAVGKF